MTLIDDVLRGALACEGAFEIQPNAGPFVERILATLGLPKGNPWCAAFVYATGTTMAGTDWPLPKTAGCQALYDFAMKKKWIRTTPQRGDVFLIWHAELARFAHTGFMLDDTDLTISGNTSGAGSRDGWLVGKRRWTFAPADRFIRWAS